MIHPDEVTNYQSLAALVAAVACLVVPQVAGAEISHESLWGSLDPGSCIGPNADMPDLPALAGDYQPADHSEPRQTGPATGESRASLAAECLEDVSANSQKSNNLCFEKAGVPASIVPTLAAKADALDQTATIVDRARELIGLESVAPSSKPLASRTGPIGTVPPSQPDPDNSCTKRPASCRSLPPLPPTLSVDAMATAPHMPATTPSIPTADRPHNEAIPERLRISHSEGYRSPPLKPPRA